MTPKKWQLVYNKYKTASSYGPQTYSIPPGLKTTLKKIHAVFSKRVPEGWLFFTRSNRPMSHSSFSKFVKTVFQTYMGKPYTQNVIRSIRVSALFKNAPSTQSLRRTKRYGQQPVHTCNQLPRTSVVLFVVDSLSPLT